jgi:hypothetical protein
VIIDEIQRQRRALIGLSFFSTTSFPYSKCRRARDATVKLTVGRVFATLNAREATAS